MFKLSTKFTNTQGHLGHHSITKDYQFTKLNQNACVLICTISMSDLLIQPKRSGPEVIKLEFILKLKIKRNDWLLADTCPQAANHCALF